MNKYHPIIVALHWLLALAIIFSLLAGTFMLAETPNSDPAKMNGLAIHMGIGLVIILLTIIRLITRLRTGAPAPAKGSNAMQEKLASAVHILLYLGVIAMGVSGIVMSQMVDLGGIVFLGSGAPLPESFDDLGPRMGHGLIAKALMALIVLHVVGAIYHQHFLRDGLMSRMSFRGK